MRVVGIVNKNLFYRLPIIYTILKYIIIICAMFRLHRIYFKMLCLRDEIKTGKKKTTNNKYFILLFSFDGTRTPQR